MAYFSGWFFPNQTRNKNGTNEREYLSIRFFLSNQECICLQMNGKKIKKKKKKKRVTISC